MLRYAVAVAALIATVNAGLAFNRLMIADYAHRSTFVTIELDEIFAQSAPSAVLVSDLPYPKSIDATGALKN